MQTIIDASGSTDPDKGPQPLSFRWTKNGREVGGTGPQLKITPSKTETMVFEVQAYNGQDYSTPVQVTVNVLPQGALPVAVPTVSQPVVKVADREKDKNNPLKVVILDGSKSTPADKLTYQWRQIDGDDPEVAPGSAGERQSGHLYKPGTTSSNLQSPTAKTPACPQPSS